jgi:hypothetical protein
MKFHIPKPSFDPLSHTKNATVERYLNNTKELLDVSLTQALPKFASHRRWNINFQQRLFLQSIGKNPEIVIKPADKNLGLTVMDSSKYDGEILRQLGDVKTYQPVENLEAIPIIKIWKQISDLGDKAFQADLIDKGQRDYLRNCIPPGQVKLPRIYILPKVHKPPPFKGRPIVPGHSWVTTPASRLLDDLIQPLLKRVPTVLADSRTLVNRLRTTKVSSDCQLFTADVVSLFTVIPLKTAIAFMNLFLKENRDMISDPLRQFILNLLQIILTNNYLEFKGKYFLQILGVAMGTPVAVVLANIFMFILERKIIGNPENAKCIDMYVRYLDDIFAVFNSNAEKIIGQLNKMHPNIKLDYVLSDSSVDFLDLHIFKGAQFQSLSLLDTTVHQKQLNSYLYIPFKSWHPAHCKGGFVMTELQRYVRNSSSFKSYLKLKWIFYARLRARGYPPKFLRDYFDRVKYRDRDIFLSPSAKKKDASRLVFLTTQWNPISKIFPLSSILRENLPRSIASEFKPMIGYSKGQSLHSLLCKNG